MTMTARERGRNLVVFIGGEEGDPDTLEVVIKPISARLGTALYALQAGIMFGQSEQVETDATNMGKLAIGEENWPIVEDELRSEESEMLIHIGYFWNVQGGGIKAVNTLLEQSGFAGGYPKAQEMVISANGHSQALALLKQLLSGAEGSGIPAPVASSGTSTPSGSAI